MGKTIGIVSLKGGVGKTSVVSSLGAALSQLGKKVLLIDANFSTPNLGIHFNIVDPEKTIHHVLDKGINLADAVHNLGDFDLVPASLSYRNNINPLRLKDNIKNLKKDYDVILIDSSPSLNDETLAAMLASDAVLVVTTPDCPTLSMTMKAIKLAKQRGTPIYGLILNKVHDRNFELSIEDIEKTAEVPVLAVVPYDINMLKSLSVFEPLTTYKPGAEGSVELMKLASIITGEKYKPRRVIDFLRIATPSRQEINRELFYDRVFR